MVEAAMDIYDKLGADGFKAEYPQFDEPKDYWVRPSQTRRFSRYPSKQIAAIALGVPTLGGGLVETRDGGIATPQCRLHRRRWRQRSCARATKVASDYRRRSDPRVRFDQLCRAGTGSWRFQRYDCCRQAS